ncbi:hypothetical protein AMECASPLE_008764 [Ameca splendens]|uniref:Uncharacterized protein n=1 Tax=Ameca splendens TaxID=208324 RepID=A0ABV0YB80_9TELE
MAQSQKPQQIFRGPDETVGRWLGFYSVSMKVGGHNVLPDLSATLNPFLLNCACVPSFQRTMRYCACAQIEVQMMFRKFLEFSADLHGSRLLGPVDTTSHTLHYFMKPLQFGFKHFYCQTTLFLLCSVHS